MFLCPKPDILTEYALLWLTKSGICFTFPAHKVKIKNSLRPGVADGTQNLPSALRRQGSNPQ
jgi:hypothetical protein